MVQIRDLREDDIPGLAALYNEHASALPNCRPVQQDEFRRGLQQLWPRGRLRDTRIIVGVAEGQLLGYLHIAVGEFTDVYEQEQSGGVTIFFTYTAGHRRVGQLLLDEAEEHMRRMGTDSVWAYQIVEGYPFYGLGNLSDRMGHVCALLGANGYRPNEEWVVLERQGCSIERPTGPADQYEIAFPRSDSSALLLELRFGEKLIGECRAFPRQVGSSPEDSLYISDLVIYPEEAKGIGLGRYLLLEMLWRAQELGHRHSLVKTLCDNHTAQLLYTSVGYHVCDVTRGYHKNLRTTDAGS